MGPCKPGEATLGPCSPDDVNVVLNEVYDVGSDRIISNLSQPDTFVVTVKECVDLERKWQVMQFETKCTHTVKFTANYENGDTVKGKWLENAFRAIYPEMEYELSKERQKAFSTQLHRLRWRQ